MSESHQKIDTVEQPGSPSHWSSISKLDKHYKRLGSTLANALMHISLKDNYIYFKIPKVASSTLSKSLSLLETRDYPDIKQAPHPGVAGSVFVKPFQLPVDDLKPALVGDDFKRFVFVRHPFSRLLSAYLHYIQPTDDERPSRRQVRTFLGRGQDQITDVISFDDFLQVLADIPKRKMDQHFRPQAMLAGIDLFDHQFIGRIENMDEDLVRLSDFLGLRVTDYMSVRTQHKTGATESWRSEVTPERKKIVERLFSKDFEAFGYDF